MLKSLARIAVVGVSVACILTGSVPPAAAADPGWTLLGWNDLGMHCMDADYSVMAILPPYNTIHAQLVDPDGDLLTDPAGITVTYEAVADPVGSLNTSSIAKTDFWDHVLALFGVSPSPDTGLAGFSMPGAPSFARNATRRTPCRGPDRPGCRRSPGSSMTIMPGSPTR